MQQHNDFVIHNRLSMSKEAKPYTSKNRFPCTLLHEFACTRYSDGQIIAVDIFKTFVTSQHSFGKDVHYKEKCSKI